MKYGIVVLGQPLGSIFLSDFSLLESLLLFSETFGVHDVVVFKLPARFGTQPSARALLSMQPMTILNKIQFKNKIKKFIAARKPADTPHCLP